MSEQSRLDVMRCRECGERRCVESPAQRPQCVAPGDAHGFVIEHIEVTILGRCPSCATRRDRDHVLEAG